MKKSLLFLSLMLAAFSSTHKAESISLKKVGWGAASFVGSLATLYSASIGSSIFVADAYSQALSLGLLRSDKYKSSNPFVMKNVALTGALLLATKYCYDKYQEAK